jgi:(1->4)-alpha-D-glucan 1-alpha-D-glucosylmutase
MTAYMEKATREAKEHTSWRNPNEAYDRGLHDFITTVMADETFLADLADFVAGLVPAGRVNSLAQTLIKLTAPGVPDIYQGTELWDLSLVDPDNRRPVDFTVRRKRLAELENLRVDDILARMDEGLPKLWLIRQSLRVRRDRRELFGPHGSYQPLSARGPKAEHVVAFVRGQDAITVAPRWMLRLDGDWGDTTLPLPAGRWRNSLTGDEWLGGETRLDEILARFPVALLVRQEE